MKTKALCAVLCGLVAVGGLVGLRRSGVSASTLPSPSLKQVAIIALAAAASAAPEHSPAFHFAGKPENIELNTAIDRGLLTAQFEGNGRERITAALTSKAPMAFQLKVFAGQMFDNGRSTVIVVRSSQMEMVPGKAVNLTVETAATRSANKLGDTAYHISYGRMPRLEPLLAYVGQHPELSASAIQTAVMALTENLPLSAVSKFASASGDLPSRFDNSAFRADTFDILKALNALREIGVKDSAIAMTIDPQLKIEAMIEPLTRAIAMRYYGIAPENEWTYWKTELLNGDPSTRHYALFGIARFYPDIALDMLPKWARQTKTKSVFRVSAIQALADTQRAEAVPILRQLIDEFGRNTAFGRAAANAARYLDASLAKLATTHNTVAFRDSKTVSQF
jgi:hypothetical protein